MICLNNITLNLDKRMILDNVSLHIPVGETAVILGPSGAGKSTILRAILGLWKPQSGSIFVDRVRISSLSEKQMLPIRRNMAMVFQNNALFDSLTVEDNISFFLKEQAGIPLSDIKNRVEAALAFVNLKGAGQLYPGELSGGMKKRVAIARAIVLEPKVILFDEPTTGLDPLNAKSVIDLINKIKESGTTSVIVTHILREALLVADKLIIINQGIVVQTGPVNEILMSSDPFVQSFFSELYEEADYLKSSVYETERAIAV
jgi:phospholipid/cholesterol/gamma-HCH transport system ATP-binding protein